MFDVVTSIVCICVCHTQHFSTQKVLLTQKNNGTNGSLTTIVCLIIDVITWILSICICHTQHLSTQKVLLTQKNNGTNGFSATTVCLMFDVVTFILYICDCQSSSISVCLSSYSAFVSFVSIWHKCWVWR